MSTTKKNKVEQKKDEVKNRAEKLDPNNNKNLPGKPMVKHGKTKTNDDGFEHRTSKEAAE